MKVTIGIIIENVDTHFACQSMRARSIVLHYPVYRNSLRENGISVVLAAADTHRAGAIEQLQEHGEKLGVKVIAQRYGADPSAVARDAVEYATKHGIQVALLDTAGRMNNSKPLMNELNKVVRVAKPDMKIFIGDALTGNDAIDQAKIFYNYTEFDGVIMTKMDVDTKGGSAISISYITSKPIFYVGTWQGYDDLQSFDSEKFIQKTGRGTYRRLD
jgi:fused signal recognition particle receptor